MNPTRLKTGDILHCTGHKWLSKMIRKFTKSKFSHSALFIEIWGQAYIIDAQNDGVNLRPFSEWQKTYGYDFVIHRPNKGFDEKELSIRALTKVGNTAYDFESLILKHPWTIITNSSWRLKKDPYERMTCSEFVAWVFGTERSYRISPEDLHNWCLINNFSIIELD